MSLVRSIDPGSRDLGWALWRFGELTRCGLARTQRTALEGRCLEFSAQLPDAHRTVVEVMEWRPEDVRSRPNDLLDVQAVGCYLAGETDKASFLRARDWKGSIPKNVHHARIWDCLLPAEMEIATVALATAPKKNRKEILDAIGIGLAFARRINRGGGPRQ